MVGGWYIIGLNAGFAFDIAETIVLIVKFGT